MRAPPPDSPQRCADNPSPHMGGRRGSAGLAGLPAGFGCSVGSIRLPSLTRPASRRIAHKLSGKKSASTFTVVVLAVALVITASILVHVMFASEVTDLTVELLAAIIAVVLVVASVGVTIHFQVRSETEREYRVELFRQKLELYKDTIACVTRSDDDGVIDDHEIEEMRNYARMTALVGNRELVSSLAEFVAAVEQSRSITRDEEQGSFRSVLQEMRNDLGVVEGDVRESVKRLMKS